jgi:hypothetical protein
MNRRSLCAQFGRQLDIRIHRNNHEERQHPQESGFLTILRTSANRFEHGSGIVSL